MAPWELEQIASRWGWSEACKQEVAQLLLKPPSSSPSQASTVAMSGAFIEDRETAVRAVSAAHTLSELAEHSAPDTWVESRAMEPMDPLLPPLQLALPPRYEDLGPIGEGGMGEVRRVRDRVLDRTLAMKIIRPRIAAEPGFLTRFVEEAQITAGIQHPGIVPVHDLGRLPDGRLYFTMREVRGRTLTEVIREVHGASPPTQWEAAPSGWTFRRLIDAFHAVTEAVAYAHRHGVVHRDLKPGNVMVGDFGEVLVLDWGLARAGTAPAAEPRLALTSGSRTMTMPGTVVGTPAYMSPEQARGDAASIDARSDVYLLGGILEEILTGQLPGRGAVTKPVPEDLLTAARRARAEDRADRFADAVALAEEIGAWLDGARKRERALAMVARAERRVADAGRLREEARAGAEAAEARLATVPLYAPEPEKEAGWALADLALETARAAELAEIEADHLLHAAFAHVPDLPEAHAALGERHRARHAEAEADRDVGAAAREETLTRVHAEALPPDHPARARLTAWLRGDGAITLYTSPPGAEAQLFAYTERNRRLVPVPAGMLGRTPLLEVPLPHGSWLIRLTAPGHEPTDYPVFIDRGAHWTGAPGQHPPALVPLPPLGTLGPDERYVPPGPFLSGGDPRAPQSTPRRWLCTEGMIFQRFPVTNADYLRFLDDLVVQGREEEALRHAPRERSTGSAPAAQIYGRRADGGFCVRADGDGDTWPLDWPVMMVEWYGACAYARWLAARTGLPWRLPGELEWEKAARGVDGRAYPWGDGFDPSWTRMRDSLPGRPLLSSVDSFPIDASPYGVRGMAGNVRDWCADTWYPDGPAVGPEGQVFPVPLPTPPDLPPPDGSTDGLFRARRGGAYTAGPGDGRVAFRTRAMAHGRDFQMGFRLVRSWP